MNAVVMIFQQMLIFSIPLMIVALGGLFSERSGVINIALEGVMITGAFTGVFFINIVQPALPGQPVLFLGMLVAAVSGMIISLPHAFASVTLKANQVISGTAINLFTPALVIFIARTVQESSAQQVHFKNQFLIREMPVLSDIPLFGPLFFQNAYLTTFVGIAILLLSWYVLYKTRFGLRLRSCGEHPQASDSVGIHVRRMQYAGVAISGALAGVGGLVYIIPTSTAFNASVSGYGFLALAVLIFGQWRPMRVAAAAVFFGLMKTIAAMYSSIPVLAAADVPSDVYKMLPYIATLVVLLFTGRKSRAPKAAGVAFDAGVR